MTLIIKLGIVKNIFEDALHYGLYTKMKNSEYDQEIPQSQTADKPIAA